MPDKPPHEDELRALCSTERAMQQADALCADVVKAFRIYADHTTNCTYRMWGHVPERDCSCKFLKMEAIVKKVEKSLAARKEDVK